ncbi:MAG: S9 family peptidase [Actinomycetota bacterium]|nr:S9 family peptidase [Actinomycetota bacterium]
MSDVLRSLLETRSTLLADVERSSEERLLVRSDRSGTMQLYELQPGPGDLRRLTHLPDPVARAAYVSGSRSVVVEVDRDGDERHQLFILDLDQLPSAGARSREELTAITRDPRFGHHLAGVAPDGSALAFTSNRRNGVDFDLWIHEFASGSQRCLYDAGGWCQPASGFSPDGRWVSVLRPGPRPLDTDLLLVEVATGTVCPVLPHPEEAALVGAPAWVGPGRFWVASTVGRDFAAIVSAGTSAATPAEVVSEDSCADLDVLSSPAGHAAAVIANRDGASEVSVVVPGATEGGEGTLVQLPEPGVVLDYKMTPPRFSVDGQRLYFSLSTTRVAGDVWVFDRATSVTRRLTNSPAPVAPEELVAPELYRVASFDGEEIPLAVYRPERAATGLQPVVVFVHGGPESEATRSWNPVVQGLVAAGFGVVVPNVRGSTGYGKRYASLDDTTRRLDSVRDLAAVHAWLAGAGFDPRRAALWGGSYGGYMVLAGVAFQPELWAAGVDIVGISDLVTFLENTSDYRRSHRELEYGSLRRDRDFLAMASPLRSAEAIRAPLFVIHGRNDPRVPVSEAEQLVAILRSRGVRCELTVYEDEGHGLARLTNRLDAYPRALAFLRSVLRA